jgi:hypothetical protein
MEYMDGSQADAMRRRNDEIRDFQAQARERSAVVQRLADALAIHRVRPDLYGIGDMAVRRLTGMGIVDNVVEYGIGSMFRSRVDTCRAAEAGLGMVGQTGAVVIIVAGIAAYLLWRAKK